jgi:hypothetical protein
MDAPHNLSSQGAAESPPAPAAGLTVSGVRPGGQALLVRDALQEAGELRPLLRVERGAQVVVVSAAELPHRRQHLPAAVGEVQRVMPPVGGTGPSLDEPLVIERVEDGDNPARHHPHVRRDRLLTAPRRPGDHAQQTRLRRREAERFDALGKPAGRVRADLRNQERGALRGLPSITHGMSVLNDSPHEQFTR